MSKIWVGITVSIIFLSFLVFVGCKKEEKKNIPPTVGEKPKIEKIEASSVLIESSKEPNRFAPEKINDGLASTCWAEGVKGSGQGEWVKFTFDMPVDITGIEVANGFATNEEIYSGNAAVKLLAVEYSNGEKANVKLKDTDSMQTISLSVKAVTWVKFTIDQVYRGDKWQDTCISELRPTFTKSVAVE